MGGLGETQIEADRRMIDEKITRIRRQLEKVVRTRALHRKKRRRVPNPVVALVGYTNAGKSTLFNRLTAAQVQAEDMLFATLDPTMRRLRLPSGRIAILSDTVGFVSNLPTQLVAAFRATLEEVLEADLVLHVRDVSHPDTELQAREVHKVLTDLGLDDTARAAMVEVQNKIDLLTPVQRQLAGPGAMSDVVVPVAAATGENCSNLLDVIEQRLFPRRLALRLALTHAAGSAIAWLYRHADVQRREDTAEGVTLRLEITEKEFFQFTKQFPGAAHVMQRDAIAAQ